MEKKVELQDRKEVIWCFRCWDVRLFNVRATKHGEEGECSVCGSYFSTRERVKIEYCYVEMDDKGVATLNVVERVEGVVQMPPRFFQFKGKEVHYR